jgi:hypothetical protein
LRRAGGGTVGVRAFADVPGAETKFVIAWHKCGEGNVAGTNAKWKKESLNGNSNLSCVA